MVRALDSMTGIITDTYEYTAYGETIKETGGTENPYRYRGEQSDSTTGLYYLRARYMNPSTGQFLSKDSYEGDTSNPITLHKYLYAHANPVTYEDPSGYAVGLGKINIATAMKAAILSINTGSSVPVLKIAQSVAVNVAVNALFYQRLMDIADGVSIGDELWDLYDRVIRAAKGEHEDLRGESEHTKNKRPSTKNKHERGQTRRGRDKGGEKGDSRRTPRKDPRK